MEIKEFKELVKTREEELKIAREKEDNMPMDLDWGEYQEYHEEIYEKYNKLDLIVKKHKPRDIIEMSDLPDYGDHMTLEMFVNACKSGMFIDYDGNGDYATEDQVSDLIVSPSDITSGEYRTDFTHIVWYNK